MSTSQTKQERDGLSDYENDQTAELSYVFFIIISAIISFLPLFAALQTTKDIANSQTITMILTSSSYRESAIASLALIIPTAIDSLLDVLFRHSDQLMERKSIGLSKLERWLFIMGIALPSGTIFLPLSVGETIGFVYFVSAIYAMVTLCIGSMLVFYSRKCGDKWTKKNTWCSLIFVSLACMVHSISCGSNDAPFPHDSPPRNVKEILLILGYALLGIATIIFLTISGTWWNEVLRLWGGSHTSSSVSDIHVKLKMGQSIVPAVYILSILFLLIVAAVLPALLRVESYLAETSLVLLNFLTMAASLTTLVVETRLKKFQIIVGLDALATRRAFVRYISHEVRTPLNIISLGLDLLEDELKEDDSNELNVVYVASVQQVQDSCRVAVGIMNDLIQYDSVQDGDIELNTTSVQGLSMMREVIRPIKTQAEQLGVTLSCNFLNPGPSHSSSAEYRGSITPRPGGGGITPRPGGGNAMQDVLSSMVSSQHRGVISHSASATHDLDVIGKVWLAVDRPKINQVMRSILQKAVQCSPAGSTVTVSLRLAKHLGPKAAINDDENGWICLPSSVSEYLSGCCPLSMGYKTAPMDDGKGEAGNAGINFGSINGGEGGYREIDVIPEGHDEEKSEAREAQRLSSGSGRISGKTLSLWSRIRQFWSRKGVTPMDGNDPSTLSPGDRNNGSLMLVPTLIPTFAAGGLSARPTARPTLHTAPLNTNAQSLPPVSQPSYHHGVKLIPNHEPQVSSDDHRRNVLRELNVLSSPIRSHVAEDQRSSNPPSDIEQGIDTSDARLSPNIVRGGVGGGGGVVGGGGVGGGGSSSVGSSGGNLVGGAPIRPRPKVPPIGLSLMNSPRRYSREGLGGNGSNRENDSHKVVKGSRPRTPSDREHQPLNLSQPSSQPHIPLSLLQPSSQPHLSVVGSTSSLQQHQLVSPRSSHMAERIQGAFSGAFSHLSVKSSARRDPSRERAARHEKELVAMANKFNYLIVEVTDASNLGVAEGDVAQMLRDALHFDTKELQGTGSFGLGLILSHGYLIAHGGELWMRSQGLGKGRTVAFALPLTKQPTPMSENKVNLSASNDQFGVADSGRPPLTPGRESRGRAGMGDGGSGSHSHHQRILTGSLGQARNLSPRRRGGSVGDERNKPIREDQNSPAFSFSDVRRSGLEIRTGGRGRGGGDESRSELFSFMEIDRSGPRTPPGVVVNDGQYDPWQARSLAALSTLDPENEVDERVARAASRVSDQMSGPRVLSPQRISSKHRMSSKQNQRDKQAQLLLQEQNVEHGQGDGQDISSNVQLSNPSLSLSRAGGGAGTESEPKVRQDQASTLNKPGSTSQDHRILSHPGNSGSPPASLTTAAIVAQHLDNAGHRHNFRRQNSTDARNYRNQQSQHLQQHPHPHPHHSTQPSSSLPLPHHSSQCSTSRESSRRRRRAMSITSNGSGSGSRSSSRQGQRTSGTANSDHHHTNTDTIKKTVPSLSSASQPMSNGAGLSSYDFQELASLQDTHASFSLQAQVVSVLSANDAQGTKAEQQPLLSENLTAAGGGDIKNVVSHSGGNSGLKQSGRIHRNSSRDSSNIRHKNSRDSSREASQRIAEVIIEHHQAHTTTGHHMQGPGLGSAQGQGLGSSIHGPGSSISSQPLEYTNAEVQLQEINAINLAKLQMRGTYQPSHTPSVLGRSPSDSIAERIDLLVSMKREKSNLRVSQRNSFSSHGSGSNMVMVGGTGGMGPPGNVSSSKSPPMGPSKSMSVEQRGPHIPVLLLPQASGDHNNHGTPSPSPFISPNRTPHRSPGDSVLALVTAHQDSGQGPNHSLGNSVRKSSHDRGRFVGMGGDGQVGMSEGRGMGAGGGGTAQLQSPYNLSGVGDVPNSLGSSQGPGLAQGQGLIPGGSYAMGDNHVIAISGSRRGSGGSTGGNSVIHPHGGGGGSGNGSFNAGNGMMTLIGGSGGGSDGVSMVGVSGIHNGEGSGLDGEGIGNQLVVNPYNTANLHVLVVDDSSINRKMLVKVLNNLKYTSEEAEDGIQAVQLITRTMRLMQQHQQPQESPLKSSSHSGVLTSTPRKQISSMSSTQSQALALSQETQRKMSIQLTPAAAGGGLASVASFRMDQFLSASRQSSLMSAFNGRDNSMHTKIPLSPRTQLLQEVVGGTAAAVEASSSILNNASLGSFLGMSRVVDIETGGGTGGGGAGGGTGGSPVEFVSNVNPSTSNKSNTSHLTPVVKLLPNTGGQSLGNSNTSGKGIPHHSSSSSKASKVSRTSVFFSIISGKSENKKNISNNSSIENNTVNSSNNTNLLLTPRGGGGNTNKNGGGTSTNKKTSKPNSKVRMSYIAAAQSFLNRGSSSLRNSRGGGESGDAGENDGGDYFGVTIHPTLVKKIGGDEVGRMTSEDLTSVRPFDLILCDNVMPNMDGPTAVKHIRDMGYSGAIFGVTGNVLPSDVEHFLSKGADVVLGKPLKISELKSAIRTYYKKKEENDQLLLAAQEAMMLI